MEPSLQNNKAEETLVRSSKPVRAIINSIFNISKCLHTYDHKTFDGSFTAFQNSSGIESRRKENRTLKVGGDKTTDFIQN